MKTDRALAARGVATSDAAGTPADASRTPRPFRIGIVGAGMITEGSHAPQTLATPMAVLAALVDPVKERAQRLAASYGIRPLIAADLDDVLPALDGAIIATPNYTHCELALRCLEAGVAVLVEKPLATSVVEGERIAEAARRARRVAAVGYSTRFYANVSLMGKLIERRYFGAIRRFVYQFGTPGGWAPLSSYNLSREKTGGGVLVVTGTHFLDRMLAWFGYPAEISFEDDSDGGPEANCVARFRFDLGSDPCEGEARFSKTMALRAGLVMDTERGIVTLLEGPHAPILLRPHDEPDVEVVVGEPRALPERPEKDNFQLQVEDFIRACRSGCRPLVPAERGTESLQLIEALYACRRPLRPDPDLRLQPATGAQA
jgi:predicted dehydrogenase